jgi:hypothetical protein
LFEEIELTDFDENLQIFSYKKCDMDTSDEVKKYRGAVFNGNTLLLKSNYTPEYDENSKISEVLSTIPFDPNNNYKLRYFPSEEGSVIRIFFFKKWYISTHRSLDAFKSKWASKVSFGEIFEQAIEHLGMKLDVLLSSLEQDKVYLFFIKNIQENRIVCKVPEHPDVLYLGFSSLTITDKFTIAYDSKTINPILSQIPIQVPLYFRSFDQIFSYVKYTDPFVRQGILIIREDGQQVKLINSKYQLYTKVRGNETSIDYRYICVRNNPVYSQLLRELYPDHIPTFKLYEELIFQAAKNIHKVYIDRFINKTFVKTDQYSHVIIKDAHSRHLANRVCVKITLDIILNILIEEKYHSLVYRLIKFMLNTKEKSI